MAALANTGLKQGIYLCLLFNYTPAKQLLRLSLAHASSCLLCLVLAPDKAQLSSSSLTLHQPSSTGRPGLLVHYSSATGGTRICG